MLDVKFYSARAVVGGRAFESDCYTCATRAYVELLDMIAEALGLATRLDADALVARNGSFELKEH